MQIGIAKPYIGPEEKQAVMEVLESGQLVQGAWVAQFEERFAAMHGARHAVAASNGTTALMASLMAHEVGPGDEVIIPSFSFFATASCVLSVGATPVFADIDPATFTLSVEAAEAAITERTKAVMPVHLYGHPADMPAFDALCQRRGLLLLEDAAQAHLARVGERFVGTWGTASFSFYPSKNMTTSEGGMVLTNDDEIARRLRMIRNQGMNTQYRHEVIGYNLRMTNIAAAIGLKQLDRLADWTETRIDNARRYNTELTSVATPITRDGFTHVFHQYTVRTPPGADRDTVLGRLQERGVGARVYYPTPIHEQPIFQERAQYAGLELPETARATREVFSLPAHPLLSPSEVEYVISEVNNAC